MKKERASAKYDKASVLARRKFPTVQMFLMCFILLVQLVLIVVGFTYRPKPQDVIRQYDVTVEPLPDGSLDIAYHFVWEALDPMEELTWVEIGMANGNFSVYPDSVSSNVGLYNRSVSSEDYIYYTALRLDFKNTYIGGDVIDFSFKINQRDLLCQNEAGYFYEFVPGWFNAIPVENYEFRWKKDGKDLVERGSLDCGEYRKMTVQYEAEDFLGCETAPYIPFDDEGAFNELHEDKTGVTVMCIVFALLLVIAEVYIVDCYVSYERGRGFLRGHGHHVHTYGMCNPHYIRARRAYNATHSGRFGGGGGCACACACACAGGGRAGCSQKDTIRVNTEE